MTCKMRLRMYLPRVWDFDMTVRCDLACTCQRGWDFDMTCKMRLCMYLPEGVGF